jgi:methanogenic corrinoid protein MtbC1
MAGRTVPTDVTDRLGGALIQGEADAAVAAAREALARGVDPLALIQEVLVPTLTEVGRRFEELEIYLPELLASGEAGNACSQAIETALVQGGRAMQAEGVIVLGTVTGDIHDIGKNIVGSLFKAHGYKVIDLGKNVSAAAFIDAAEANRANVIAASALMSITRTGCREVAELRRELNLTDKYLLIVGGGSLDQAYADEIGADGYAETASGAVELVRSLLRGG